MEDRFPTELQETANNFHTALSDIDNTLKLLHESSLEELEAKVIVFFLYFHPREREVKFNCGSVAGFCSIYFIVGILLLS